MYCIITRCSVECYWHCSDDPVHYKSDEIRLSGMNPETNLNVFLDIRFIVSHNECIWQISAFNLHKAVSCVANATWQQFALQHCVYYSTLAI